MNHCPPIRVPLFLSIYRVDGRRIAEFVVDPEDKATLECLPSEVHDFEIHAPNGNQASVRLALGHEDPDARYRILAKEALSPNRDNAPFALDRFSSSSAGSRPWNKISVGVWSNANEKLSSSSYGALTTDEVAETFRRPVIVNGILSSILCPQVSSASYQIHVVLEGGASIFLRVPHDNVGTTFHLSWIHDESKSADPLGFCVRPVLVSRELLCAAYHGFLRNGATRAAKAVGNRIAQKCIDLPRKASMSYIITAAHWTIRFTSSMRIISFIRQELLPWRERSSDADTLLWILDFDHNTSGRRSLEHALSELLGRLKQDPPVFVETLRLFMKRIEYFLAHEDVLAWKKANSTKISWLRSLQVSMSWNLEHVAYRAIEPNDPRPSASSYHLRSDCRKLVSCADLIERGSQDAIPNDAQRLLHWLVQKFSVVTSPNLPFGKVGSEIAQTLVRGLESRYLEFDQMAAALSMARNSGLESKRRVDALATLFFIRSGGPRRVTLASANSVEHLNPVEPLWRISVQTERNEYIDCVMSEGNIPDVLLPGIIEDAVAEECNTPASEIFSQLLDRREEWTNEEADFSI